MMVTCCPEGLTNEFERGREATMQGEQRVALVQFLAESSKRKLGVSSVFWIRATLKQSFIYKIYKWYILVEIKVYKIR